MPLVSSIDSLTNSSRTASRGRGLGQREESRDHWSPMEASRREDNSRLGCPIEQLPTLEVWMEI